MGASRISDRGYENGKGQSTAVISIRAFPLEKRLITREVALTYRRTRRALAAEGVPLQRQELAAVDAAIAIYQRLDPDAPATVEGAIATSKQFLGCSLPDDLLPAFGDTWAVFDTPDQGGFLFTGTVLVAEVKDADAVQRMLAQLAQVARHGIG